MQSVTAKDKKCKAKGCGREFRPIRPMQCVCSPVCGLSVARAKREQAEAKKLKEQRKKDREKREGLKTRRDYLRDAQREFNRYIRLRDAHEHCICCGAHLRSGDSTGVGGGYDCGHYRSVGSAPQLRFNEDNAHGQRKLCNRWGAGRAVDYRMGLIQRIGLDRVEALEADQTPRKYTIEDLKQIIATYRAKCKELEKA